MPIYEFYCRDCRTVFNFFSRRIDTTSSPACPRCRRLRLERWVSRFAAPSGRQVDDAGSGLPDSPEDARMERALESLAGEAESLSDEDPRQAAKLMRRFSELSGMPLTGGMQEALQRLEKGEDPERIEEEMGDILENEEPFEKDVDDAAASERLARRRRAARPIRYEEKLYELTPEQDS